MNPRSGLTYIIVNKKTKLVLDDPVSEGGYVNVSHLNKDDTQKVWVQCHAVTSPLLRNLPHIVVDAFSGPRWPLDSSKCEEWQIPLHENALYETRGPCDRDAQRWSGIPLVHRP